MQTLSDREGSQFKSENGTTWARFKAGKTQSTAAESTIDIDNFMEKKLGRKLQIKRIETNILG